MFPNFDYENDCYANGYKRIAGIDEVGRGCLAGPVVACAVILPKDFALNGVLQNLNDSKKLSAKKREIMYWEIAKQASSIGFGFVNERIIDEINILNASKLAMLIAISKLKIQPDYLLIDHVKLAIDLPQANITKGDSISVSIAAASVCAKFARDTMMQKIHENYLPYNFASNAGYGTKEHKDAIELYGLTNIHRKSFKIS